MSELKTQRTEIDVLSFLENVEPEKRRRDGRILFDMMKEITQEEPAMWGPTIIGFGQYRYKYESGREGEWFKLGFSPRKDALTLYIMPGFGKFPDLLERLGTYKTGKSCLYIDKLEDIDVEVLKEMMRLSYDYAGTMFENE